MPPPPFAPKGSMAPNGVTILAMKQVDFNNVSEAGHSCIRKLFGLDSETCIRKLFPVDSETFPGGFGNFPVGFGNFPGCIRELVYSGNWDLVTKPLSSETFPGVFGNLYSETFPGGFGNLYSETFPGGFGNFSGWIRKLARLDSETFPVGFRNLIQKFVFFARCEET